MGSMRSLVLEFPLQWLNYPCWVTFQVRLDAYGLQEGLLGQCLCLQGHVVK